MLADISESVDLLDFKSSGEQKFSVLKYFVNENGPTHLCIGND